MIGKQAYRNLLASKLRLFLTSLAVMLGVGFVVGAFVLGDTISKAFDGVFETANEGVAVQVRGVKTVSDADRQPVPATLLPTIRAVNGVAQAEGTVFGTAQIIGKDGKAAGIAGPPALGFGWSDDAELNPLRITAGSPPARRTTWSSTRRPPTTRTSRSATGCASSPRRARPSTGWSGSSPSATRTTSRAPPSRRSRRATAQRIFDSTGQYLTIDVRGDPGVSDAALAERVQQVLPSGYEAITGDDGGQGGQRPVQAFVDIFRNFLLGFAAIALFVGSFIIFNAFKITVAQRTRQVGLLRAVGASGRQVVLSVLLEALFIGLIASIIGIIFGIAFAALLRAGLQRPRRRAAAHQPPDRAPLDHRRPGRRGGGDAGRGPHPGVEGEPRAADRGDARDRDPDRAGRPPGDVDRHHRAWALLLVLGGLLASGGLGQRFAFIGAGAVLLFIGAAMLTQYVARPLAKVIGWPMAKTGLAGRLGQENAMRNPSRTAQTAAALTIGVALVTGVTVFASSLQETFIGTLDKRVRADLVIFSSSQQPFSPAAAASWRATPRSPACTAWRDGEFKDSRRIDPGRVGHRPEHARRRRTTRA